MGATIDTLDIQISANVSNAKRSVDNLSKSLSGLNSALGTLNGNNLASFSQSMGAFATSINTIATASKGLNFGNLAKQLNKVANINVSQLSAVSTNIKVFSDSLNGLAGKTQGLTGLNDLAVNIGKLGNKSVDTAIQNLPKLSVELNNLLTTLAKSPKVSGDVTKLIKAITDLTAQGQKVGATSRAIGTGLTSTAKSFKTFRISALGISSVIGKLYADFWLLMRGAKTLGSSIKGALELGETLNYFEKSFDSIAKNSTANWSELGYESANAYYESFSKRASEITGKLTGLNVGNNGIGVFNGKNLGLNTNEVMQYQAQYGQMANSLGVSSENAMRLSEVLTKLGGDLASIKDMDFNTVWGNMTSMLSGMSRTMDKYGVNIREANLNQELINMGISATVDQLSSEDKVLLRTIVTLKSSKYAWGDLSNTLYSNANQLRLLQSNWQKLGTIIGTFFTSALAKVLPYINAVLVALQKLAVWVMNLFGIKADFGTAGAMGDLSGISDALDGVGESAKGTGDKIKKMKNQLLGLDELNVITTPQDSGGSGGVGGGGGASLNDAFIKATEEYLKAWEDAYSQLEDKIGQMADGLNKKLEPVKELFRDIKNGNWREVGGDLSDIFYFTVEGISDLLRKVDWEQIGANIGEFLKGIKWSKLITAIKDLLSTVFTSALGLWEGSFDKAPIETAIATMLASLTIPGVSLKNAVTITLTAVTFEIGFEIGKAIGKALFPEDKAFYGESLSADLEIIAHLTWTDLINALGEMRKESPLLYALFTLTTLPFSLATNIAVGLKFDLPKIKEAWNGFEKWFKDNVSVLIKDAEDLLVVGLADMVSPANIIESLSWWEELANATWTAIKGIISSVSSAIWQGGQDIKNDLKNNLSAENIKNAIYGIVSGFTSIMSNAKNEIYKKLVDIKNNFTSMFGSSNSVSGWLVGLKNGFTNIMNDIKSIVQTICNAIKDVINSIFGISSNFNFSGLSNALTNAISTATNNSNTVLDGLFSRLNQLNVEISNSSQSAVSLVASGGAIASAITNAVTSAVNTATNKSNTNTTGKKTTTSTYKGSKAGMPTNIPKHADGGFVKAGLFWAGENGVPELLGSVGGKVAVAGGNEITGISSTIRSTSAQEIELLRQQNQLLSQLLAKPTGITESELFNSVRKSSQKFTQNTGKLAF